MTYKQIEASREARLWIKDVIVPIAGAIWMGYICMPSEVKEKIGIKAKSVKESIKKKFKRD